jgi:hypothetical protein
MEHSKKIFLLKKNIIIKKKEKKKILKKIQKKIKFKILRRKANGKRKNCSQIQ